MANTKLSDLTALTAPSGDDLLYVVDDPAGTPADRKMALNNLFTRGTVTTSSPIIDAAQTWNASGTTFTALRLNVTDTASAAGSLLMDLQVGGASRFSVGKGAGAIFATNLIEQRNGVNAQAYNLYNTFTDASNYERFSMKWDANVFKFGNENAGTGSSFRNIEFYRGGVKMITLTGGEVSIDGGWLELKNAFTPWLIIPEDSSPPTFGYVNKAVIFAEDDGTGKTRLMVRFATGAAQQIAIEP